MQVFINLLLAIGVVLFIMGCLLGPAFRGTVRLVGGLLLVAVLLFGLIIAQTLLWLLILVGAGSVVLANRLRRRRR